MPTTRVRYACQACGHVSPKWLGRCPACGEWNTFVEEPAAPLPRPPVPRPPARAAEVVSIADVALEREPRATTGIAEFDRVLGGGLVPGALVLIGGDPGIGKSTLLTQVAARVAAQGRTVLYVSAEESARQARLRAERLGPLPRDLLLLAETDLEAVQRAVERLRPALVVVDSIQTVYRPDVPSAPGSVAQVRECAAALLGVAKGQEVTVLLVGHVTKEGQLAGPRVLEHLVDTVLAFEGDPHHAYRLLRATKNRFGSTHELGVFEMASDGLREVPNPSAAFLAERAASASGSAIVCAMEGARPLLLEVQALVTPTHFGVPRRTAAGVDYNRMVVLLAVLEKLDRPTPQVLIEAFIVEANKDVARDLGIQWGGAYQLSGGDRRGFLTGRDNNALGSGVGTAVDPTTGNVIDLPVTAAGASSFGFIFQNVGKSLLEAPPR